jgi:hypothetical protein
VAGRDRATPAPLAPLPAQSLPFRLRLPVAEPAE